MNYKKYLGGLLLAGCTSAGVLAGNGNLHAQDQAAIEQLQKQNTALQHRLDALEDKLDNAGVDVSDPKGTATITPKVSATSAIILSGYVQTSYFDNLENPSGGYNAGYLWNTRNNNFSINKVKITLASPEVSKDKWDAGFRLSLLAGEDAPVLNSNSGTNGFQYLREAYVEFNVPVGTRC
jgi:outer membrane murein-binding lipoprotein Lpp